MQSPTIGTKRRSSTTRIALCWVVAIVAITTAVVALSGLIPEIAWFMRNRNKHPVE